MLQKWWNEERKLEGSKNQSLTKAGNKHIWMVFLATSGQRHIHWCNALCYSPCTIELETIFWNKYVGNISVRCLYVGDILMRGLTKLFSHPCDRHRRKSQRLRQHTTSIYIYTDWVFCVLTGTGQHLRDSIVFNQLHRT